MKIAVTYDNGEVFQHFGRTENFKVYEVENNQVVSSEVIGSNGIGHGALAGLLAEEDIEVLICGGIGGGAQNALSEAGITLVAGAAGNTDEVVESYLKGELVSTGANCNHHDHEHGQRVLLNAVIRMQLLIVKEQRNDARTIERRNRNEVEEHQIQVDEREHGQKHEIEVLKHLI